MILSTLIYIKKKKKIDTRCERNSNQPLIFFSILSNDMFLYHLNSSLPYGWLFKKCAAVIHHGGR